MSVRPGLYMVGFRPVRPTHWNPVNRDIASDTFVILCTGEGNGKRTLNLMPTWAPQGNYLNKNSAQYLGNVKYRFVF